MPEALRRAMHYSRTGGGAHACRALCDTAHFGRPRGGKHAAVAARRQPLARGGEGREARPARPERALRPAWVWLPRRTRAASQLKTKEQQLARAEAQGDARDDEPRLRREVASLSAQAVRLVRTLLAETQRD
jgi:hypothetical protein